MLKSLFFNPIGYILSFVIHFTTVVARVVHKKDQTENVTEVFHASTCLACRVAFVVMPRIAWVRRQRAGANSGGPPLLDLWLLCWSMAGGVVRCFIDAIFRHSLGPGVSTRGVHSTPKRAIAWGNPAN